ALLDWMADDHFTFLGYRDYELVTVDGEDLLRSIPGSGLGILRERGRPTATSFAKLPPAVRQKARDATLLNLTKANSLSTVHRPVRLDYIGIKRFHPDGETAGERRFLGLFTSIAYNSETRLIPVLRRKVAAVIERAGFAPGSHNYKN